jgi:dihydroneopterin aldolase
MTKRGDSIFIEDLQITCVVGVADWERRTRQKIVVSVELRTDTRAAGGADSLEATIDYASACEGITQIAVEGQFKLIETLAEEIAKWLLQTFAASAVAVEVKKPRALSEAASAGVRIERSNDNNE